MFSTYLWIAGSLIFFLLGVIHLVYTFFSKKLSPGSGQLLQEMKAVHPVLTRQTTMWKAWIGFNASHGIGILFFGGVNLAWRWRILNYYLRGMSLLVSLVYLLLAKKYWFNIPFLGMLIATLCFLLAMMLSVI